MNTHDRIMYCAHICNCKTSVQYSKPKEIAFIVLAKYKSIFKARRRRRLSSKNKVQPDRLLCLASAPETRKHAALTDGACGADAHPPNDAMVVDRDENVSDTDGCQ